MLRDVQRHDGAGLGQAIALEEVDAEALEEFLSNDRRERLAQRRFEVPKVVARVLDPRRAAWYSEQGMLTICPTQIAIEQLEKAALGA